jgi:hypothetical protein
LFFLGKKSPCYSWINTGLTTLFISPIFNKAELTILSSSPAPPSSSSFLNGVIQTVSQVVSLVGDENNSVLEIENDLLDESVNANPSNVTINGSSFMVNDNKKEGVDKSLPLLKNDGVIIHLYGSNFLSLPLFLLSYPSSLLYASFRPSSTSFSIFSSFVPSYNLTIHDDFHCSFVVPSLKHYISLSGDKNDDNIMTYGVGPIYIHNGVKNEKENLFVIDTNKSVLFTVADGEVKDFEKKNGKEKMSVTLFNTLKQEKEIKTKEEEDNKKGSKEEKEKKEEDNKKRSKEEKEEKEDGKMMSSEEERIIDVEEFKLDDYFEANNGDDENLESEEEEKLFLSKEEEKLFPSKEEKIEQKETALKIEKFIAKTDKELKKKKIRVYGEEKEKKSKPKKDKEIEREDDDKRDDDKRDENEEPIEIIVEINSSVEETIILKNNTMIYLDLSKNVCKIRA